MRLKRPILEARIIEVLRVIVSCFKGKLPDQFYLYPEHDSCECHGAIGREFLDDSHENVDFYFSSSGALEKVPNVLKNDLRFGIFPVSYLAMSDQEIKAATFEKYGEKLAKYLQKLGADKINKQRRKAILNQLSPEDQKLFK